MINKTKKYCFGVLLTAMTAFTLSSCDDYFDDVPNNATSLEDVFSNRGQTLSWLSNVYSYIPNTLQTRYQGGTSNGMMLHASLSGYQPWSDGGNGKHLNIINGTLSPSTGWVADMFTNYYRGIQYANVYLQHVDECDPLSDAEKATTKAECRALRAYFYFCLMKHFGPVAIIGDRVNGVEDDLGNMMEERSTVDECFDYILSEFDDVLSSGDLLTKYDSENTFIRQYAGNFTEETVRGIRSEVLLFRASYLFNGDPFYADVTNPDGKKLFPQARDNQKWIDARDAAKELIDDGQWRLVLRNSSGELVNSVDQSCPYNSVLYACIGNSDNEEMIVGTTKNSTDTYPMVPRNNGGSLPAPYGTVDGGAGAYTVPLEFVDLYFTNKGLRIEEDPDYFTYDEYGDETQYTNALVNLRKTTYNDPYSGYNYFTMQNAHPIMKQFYDREARFYLGITFQNRPWNIGNGKNAPSEMNYSGNSGPNSSGTHDYPVFGTICRKSCQYGSALGGWSYCVLLRLGEVYLNYAEACAELGELEEALTAVNAIRARAGVAEYKVNASDDTKGARGEDRIALPAYDQTTVLKAVYRERLIEMAFENKYYYDVRRWGVAEGKWRTNGEELTDGWIYAPYHKGGEGGDLYGYNLYGSNTATDLKFYKRVVQQHRIFAKRMSLLPIPQEELNRNHLCVQNKGWESTVDEHNKQ
ncbi:RagB/SusD family nutrient uptake outer membrane protein [Xylanibacter brevis]|uniref:RagB/SusD family nutrient uptake outer membrane protein n=1 Tax=Xylanibacter brevis TaxID=83231 RepID=UPI0005C4A083|nr:RagB/SusD family nutrient uptake outer membrane protein [Xylanibacter brevis]